MANTGTQGFNEAGYGYRAQFRPGHTKWNVASHTLSVRDITGFVDAGHNLCCEARLLAMTREIRQLRAAVSSKGRSETSKLEENEETSTG
jgi:hypothetical protein